MEYYPLRRPWESLSNLYGFENSFKRYRACVDQFSFRNHQYIYKFIDTFCQHVKFVPKENLYLYISIFVYCKKNLWKFHISNIHLVFHFHFRFSPLHLHSLFRRLDRFIKFVEAENSRPSLHFMVSLFKLCDKAWNASGIQILGCRLTFNVQYCYY